MDRTRALKGMTLIELLTTVAIIGILTAIALPSFRAMQVRQSLRVTQQQIESLVYRSRQLSLAPDTISGGPTYDVVGYGLLVVSASSAGSTIAVPATGGCTLRVPSDLVALVKYVRSRTNNATIRPVLHSVTDPTNCPTAIDPAEVPDDFVVLPSPLRFNPTQTSLGLTPSWLIPIPLQASGVSFGDLPVETYRNPLASSPSAQLFIQNPRVLVKGKALCQSLTFTRAVGSTVSAVELSFGAQGSCL